MLGREELFSGWRLFFERLSEFLPVVMVVEDLQWADAGMVEFLDHLLEWSGDHALFLLVLTRPEGTERRGLGLSRRSVTTLPLDPLSDEVIGELLDGLVTGLPQTARARIVERAEGIPLYAIETVRGLLDKGVLEKEGDGLLRLVGELGELEIPPGLTALIASRLDALAAERAQPREGVLGARRQLPPPGHRGRLGRGSGVPRRAVELARAQGGADCPRRQAVARTRPVRLHPVAHPIGRLRHVDESRAQGPPPADRRAPPLRLPRPGS